MVSFFALDESLSVESIHTLNMATIPHLFDNKYRLVQHIAFDVHVITELYKFYNKLEKTDLLTISILSPNHSIAALC